MSIQLQSSVFHQLLNATFLWNWCPVNSFYNGLMKLLATLKVYFKDLYKLEFGTSWDFHPFPLLLCKLFTSLIVNERFCSFKCRFQFKGWNLKLNILFRRYSLYNSLRSKKSKIYQMATFKKKLNCIQNIGRFWFTKTWFWNSSNNW